MKKYFLILVVLLMAAPAMAAREAIFTAIFTYPKDAAEFPTGFSMYINMVKMCSDVEPTIVESEAVDTLNTYELKCTTDMQYTGDLLFQLAADFAGGVTSPLSLPARFYVAPVENPSPTPLNITFEMGGRVSVLRIPTNAQ